MRKKNNLGVTFVEIIVSIFLILIIILAFGTTMANIKLNHKIKLKNQALALASEEIETLRKKPFSGLTNRTNADFLDVAYNFGSWQVKTDAAAPSEPNIYSALPLSDGNEITSLAVLPANTENNFTLEAKVRAQPSPAGYAAGLAFRYQDINNYYRFVFYSSAIKLEKKLNGTVTVLFNNTQSFVDNNWYDLKVIASGSDISLYLNNTLLGTINDTDFSGGCQALLGLNSAVLDFDNVSLIGQETRTWNFDADTPDNIAAGFERFGLNDLPGGEGRLTIEDYSGKTNIKKVTARVSWQEDGSSKFVQISTIIGQYGFNN